MASPIMYGKTLLHMCSFLTVFPHFLNKIEKVNSRFCSVEGLEDSRHQELFGKLAPHSGRPLKSTKPDLLDLPVLP